MAYHLKDKTIIQLSPEELGGGGEGKVIDIIAPAKYASYVAKIFITDNADKLIDKQKRLTYMITNKPAKTSDKEGNAFLIWPDELLYNDDKFVGFLMPKANGVLLFSLCDIELGNYPKPKHDEKLGKEWQHYARHKPLSLIYRLQLCTKLAEAVHAIHSEGRYIIGDIKPSNILVQPSGTIAIIDLDSCQIAENGNILFEGNVGTPEFSPPDKQQGYKTASWDLFILAIIFYEILCGIHPFAWFCDHPYEQNECPQHNIRDGLFLHGKNKFLVKSKHIQHNVFDQLSDSVRQLFIQCFDQGAFDSSQRPSAKEWADHLTPKPIIKFFDPDRKIIYENQGVFLTWQTEHTRKCTIEGRGEVDISGTCRVIARKNASYKLIADNEFGRTDKELLLNCYPMPAIEKLVIPTAAINLNFTKQPTILPIPYQPLRNSVKTTDNSLEVKKVSQFIMTHLTAYKAGGDFWSLSRLFEKIKKMITIKI